MLKKLRRILNLKESHEKNFLNAKNSSGMINNSKLNTNQMDNKREKPLIQIIDEDIAGREFEEIIKSILESNGFYNVKLTPASGDFGVDVLAEKDSIKYAIQCKKYSSPVGIKAVQEVLGSKAMNNSHVAVVITNNYFTRSAIELANNNNVLLWDRDKLIQMITPNINLSFNSNINEKHLSLYEDPLYDEIVAFVVESGKASAVLLQRRFRLGYNRAARVIDLLEERGIIGPQNGSKPREVLVKLENR